MVAILFDGAIRIATGLCAIDMKPFVLKQILQGRENIRVIVDNKDRVWRRRSGGIVSGWYMCP